MSLGGDFSFGVILMIVSAGWKQLGSSTALMETTSMVWWRQIIFGLDWAQESVVADHIRGYAEPPPGEWSDNCCVSWGGQCLHGYGCLLG